MLRRDRQMRMQIHQLVDACLFALSFWLAYEFRASSWIIENFHRPGIPPFESFFWVLPGVDPDLSVGAGSAGVL